nr:MAG TPA: major capsid protein [Caudoviricetes sp.]
MTVAQIYDIINPITKEILGETAVINEDLSNIVDIGKEIFDATDVDNYVKSLVNHIGRVIFVNRPYSGGAPSVLMDGWEYGSVLEKVSAELPEATENESWELTDGASYDPNIFYKPKVSAKFFNKRVTFEIPMSFTERQVKESFSNASQLNGFLSMLYNAVDKSMTIKIDSLVMRTINNMIAETLHNFNNSGDYTGTGVRAVNLLKLYNDDKGTDLTAEKSIKDPDFIRFASYIMGLYMERLSKISSLFNIGGKDRFTPRDLLHVILLSDFAKASDSFSMSSTFHNEFVALPKGEIIPYWQGSGTDYSFSSVSSINVKTASGDTVTASGIIGVMFDRDALGVTNLDRRVTTNYNPKAEFFSNWYKFDAGYFNDMNENFVLFYVA